jgi:hypothetical protein
MAPSRHVFKDRFDVVTGVAFWFGIGKRNRLGIVSSVRLGVAVRLRIAVWAERAVRAERAVCAERAV